MEFLTIIETFGSKEIHGNAIQKENEAGDEGESFKTFKNEDGLIQFLTFTSGASLLSDTEKLLSRLSEGRFDGVCLSLDSMCHTLRLICL